MSSIMAKSFYKNILSSQLITCNVLLSHSQKFAISNSNPVLFQSSLLRSYANTVFPLPPPQKDTSFSYLNKFTKVTAKRLPAIIIIQLVTAGIISLISIDLIYAYYLDERNKYLLNKTVERGTRPDVGVSENDLVPRLEIVEHLKKILQPHEDQSLYHVVYGEHGTGKTTLTRIASREAWQNKNKGIQGGMGVIYVDIPADFESLGEAFGKAINFAFEENISITGQLGRKILGITKDKPEISKWKRAMTAFKSASAVYKKKHGRPPVIVYDNVSRLIAEHPKILDILQDDAKDNADDRKYIAVFVSSEGSVPRRMEFPGQRAYKPVIEISDLSEKESKDYLIKRCTIKGKKVIKDEEVNELYGLVGGRIMDLKVATDKFLDGQSLEDIKQQTLTEVEKKFQSAQLLPNDLYYEIGKSIISDLLKSKELNFLAFKKYFKKAEELNEVLGNNIFAYHPKKNTMSFQSQSVESYIQKMTNIFVK